MRRARRDRPCSALSFARSSERINFHSACASGESPSGIAGSPGNAGGSRLLSLRLPGLPSRFLSAVGFGRRPPPLGIRGRAALGIDLRRRRAAHPNKIETSLLRELHQAIFVPGHALLDFVDGLLDDAVDPVVRDVAAGWRGVDESTADGIARVENLDCHPSQQTPAAAGVSSKHWATADFEIVDPPRPGPRESCPRTLRVSARR